MGEIAVIDGVLSRYRKNARHVIVEYREDGRIAKVVCKYKSKVEWVKVKHPCGFCGRPLDHTTFVAEAIFNKQEARRKEWFRRRSEKHKAKVEAAGGVEFRPLDEVIPLDHVPRAGNPTWERIAVAKRRGRYNEDEAMMVVVERDA